jgi:hypothetical protein
MIIISLVFKYYTELHRGVTENHRVKKIYLLCETLRYSVKLCVLLSCDIVANW